MLSSVEARQLVQEISKIESGEWPADDNPLKNAPHTQKEASYNLWGSSGRGRGVAA